jgi:hypothetical protein
MVSLSSYHGKVRNKHNALRFLKVQTNEKKTEWNFSKWSRIQSAEENFCGSRTEPAKNETSSVRFFFEVCIQERLKRNKLS